MTETRKISSPLWSWQRATLLGFFALFVLCLLHLGFDFNQLPPSADPVAAAKHFFSAAFHPAFSDQNPGLPEGSQPFLARTFEALLATIRYAFIAMSLAVPAGLLLGFFSSKSWWPERRPHTPLAVRLLRIALATLYTAIRFVITFMRSIHELIWVMLFMAFLGDSPLTACIALALPFAGTFAKVFSELIDEQSDAASTHLKLTGASSLQAFLGARLPQALPDLLTYTLYRLECSIRSSAVLGFIGIETIGLSIKQSYENNYYGEVWTELYLLIATVMFFDILGSQVRKRLTSPPLAKKTPHTLTLSFLKKCAPRWRFLTTTWMTLTALTAFAWFVGPELNAYHSALTRWERTQKFLTALIPEPVKESSTWTDALPWAHNLWATNGKEALLNTSVIATMALLLAAIFGYTLVPWASRNIATISPFESYSGKTSRTLRASWSLLGWLTRSLFLLMRSIPEYIIAFLLIGILGAHAWPLVIALALHNFGILGRLWSEISENNDTLIARQQTLCGGTRLQSYLCGILPSCFNRQLLFIFYRWETCLRESTILGMLSISSLGYYISIERSFFHYDRMLFYILLATATIFLSDLLSILLRGKLRTAGSVSPH